MRWTEHDRKLAREVQSLGHSWADTVTALQLAEYIGRIRESLYPHRDVKITLINNKEEYGAAAAYRGYRSTNQTVVCSKDGHVDSITTETTDYSWFEVYVFGLRRNIVEATRVHCSRGLHISPGQYLFSYAFHEVRHEMQRLKHTKIFAPGMITHPSPVVTEALIYMNKIWAGLKELISDGLEGSAQQQEEYLEHDFDALVIQTCALLTHKRFPKTHTEIDEIMWTQAT